MNYWQLVLRLCRFRPRFYLLYGVLWVPFYSVALLSGIVVLELFNALAGQQHTLNIWVAVALLAAIAVLRNLLHFSCNLVEYVLYSSLVIFLRRNIFEYILLHPNNQNGTHSTGEAISRFRDDVDEIALFTVLSAELIGKLVFLAFAIGTMAKINFLITLLVLLPLVAMMLVRNVGGARVKTYRAASRKTLGNVTGFLGEIFRSVQAVKVAHAEKQVLQHFDAINELRRKATLKDRLITDTLNASYMNAVNLSIGLVMLFAGTLIRTGAFTIGDFALYLAYLSGVAYLVGSVSSLFVRYKQVGISFERITEFLQGGSPRELVKKKPIYLNGALPPAPIIVKTDEHRLTCLEVSNLTYHHSNSAAGIQGINLHLTRGSFTVITGRIGSGKTTLLEVLLGLLPRSAGEIRWNGSLIDDPFSFFVPPRIAYVAQVPQLFSETLRDNILMGLPAEPTTLSSAIKTAVLEPDLQELGQGLDTLVGPRGIKLSGGQVQRSAAARAFVRTPELLIFDDLSSALDVETEHTLWTRVLERPDTTCLVVSHRQAVLQRADRIIVLKDSKVEAEGTLKALLEHSEEMQLIWQGKMDDNESSQ